MGSWPTRGAVAVRLAATAAAVLILCLLVHFSIFAAKVGGQTPQHFSCRTTAFANCGLAGVRCRPFTTDWQAFRCPARCTWGTGTREQLTLIGGESGTGSAQGARHLLGSLFLHALM